MKSDSFPTPAVNVDSVAMIPNSVINVESKVFGTTDSHTDSMDQSCIIDDFSSLDTSFDDPCSNFDSGFDSDFGTSFDDGF